MRIFIGLIFSVVLSAQPTIYVRGANAGPAFRFVSMTGGNPPTITVDPSHNFSVGDVVGIWRICAGAMFDPASAKTPAQGLHKILSTPTISTFTISDGPTSSTPLNEPNDSVECIARMADYPTTGGVWVAKYLPQTLPPGPLGWLDGQNGKLTRKLRLAPVNGLSSIVVAGCPGSCAVTVTVTPDIATIYPDGLAAGDKFSINGTSSSVLNTVGGGSKNDPYTISSVTSTSFTATASGLTNGTFTTNNACGPSANDSTSGTNPCVGVSLLAFNGNAMWDSLITAANALYGPGNPTHYQFPKDNPTTGYTTPGIAFSVSNEYSNAAFRCFIDPTDTTSCTVAVYFMRNVEQSFGIGWPCYGDILLQACGVPGGGLMGDQDEAWLGHAQMSMLMIRGLYGNWLSPTSTQTYIDKLYNDTDDPGSTVSTAHVDFTKDNVNKLLVTNKVAATNSTSFTLDSSDSAGANFYVGNVVHFSFTAAITNWTNTSGVYVATTATPWGYGSKIPNTAIAFPCSNCNPVAITISGVTGTGCSAVNAQWLLSSSPSTVIDASHFQIQNVPGCTAPVGGTVTSWDLDCSGNGYEACTGVITAYNSTTKVATVAGGFHGYTTATTGVPTTDMNYKIFQSITISDSTPYASATVTGINTHFTTDVAVGDIVIGAQNPIDFCSGQIAPWVAGSYVTTVTDDTHLAVLNMNCTSARATPKMLWIWHNWAPGDAGFRWYGNHYQGTFGKSVTHPASGGGFMNCPGAPIQMCLGSNNIPLFSHSRAGLALSLAGLDSRTDVEVAEAAGYSLDYFWTYFSDMFGGQMPQGARYSLGVLYAQGFMGSRLFAGLPGSPTPSATPARAGAEYLLFAFWPDWNWNTPTGHRPTPMYYGTQSSQSWLDAGSATIQAVGLNPIFEFAPNSVEAQHLAFLLGPQLNGWNSQIANRLSYNSIAVVHNDPRSLLRATSYLGLPLQRIFNQNDLPTCTSVQGISGASCPPAMQGSSFISKTTWTDPLATPMTGTSGTHVYFGMRAMPQEDHDAPQCGVTWIFKVGQLVGLDGTGTDSQTDQGTDIDMPRVGGMNKNRNAGMGQPLINGLPQYSFCPTTQWYSANHGSLDPVYGDQANKAVYACADMTGVWNIAAEPAAYPIDIGSRCAGDLKDTALNGGTGEQVVFQKTLIDTSTVPQTLETYIHYPQNGQTFDGQDTVGSTYNEGNTTCPGSGGCPNLNANRTIQSVENGEGPVTVAISSWTPGATTALVTASTGAPFLGVAGQISGVTGTGTCNGYGVVTAITNTTHFSVAVDTSGCSGASLTSAVWLSDFNPLRQYGVITKIFSPDTITVRDDSISITPSVVTAGNPTVFTAVANNIWPGIAITNIAQGVDGTAFTTLTLASSGNFTAPLPPNYLQTDWNFIAVRGVTGCTALNSFAAGVGKVIDPTHIEIVFDLGANGCTSPTGGQALHWPQPNVKILGATGQWAALNSNYSNGGGTSGPQQQCPACIVGNGGGTLPLTYIDADHFSVPVNSTGFSGSFDGTVYAVYPAGLGYSHRVSMIGGSAPGALVSKLRVIAVHKVMQNLSDTTFTATPITVDSNWFAVQTTDKVIVLNITNSPPTSITSFTTTHSGTAQYLIANVAAGSWAITIGGTPVSGSPFVVLNGDNTIHFESTSGVLVATPTLQSLTVTDSSPLPNGTVGTSYSHQLTHTGGTGGVSWKLSPTSVSLPLGLSVSSGGLVSGIGLAPMVTPPSFVATDSGTPPATATEKLSMTFTQGPVITASPSPLSYSCTAGGSAGSQNVSIGATGVTLDNWSATKTLSALTLTPSSGSAAGNMAVAVSCASLTSGGSPYSDTISIISTTSGITNSPLSVPVTITVAAPVTPVSAVRGVVKSSGTVTIH